MSTPNEKAKYASTYHRDGTLSYWDVMTQAWRRTDWMSDETLSTVDASERSRIVAHLGLA